MRPEIIKPEIRPAEGELTKHVKELGKRFVFFDERSLPAGNIYMIMRVVSNVREEYEPAMPRRHSVDAFMVFIGLNEDLTGMRARVRIGDSEVVEDSPFAVYVPAGTEHTYSIISGTGIYQKIVLAPRGDYNSVTE